jgi:tRNA pseudouridine32 synthase / 23S rRNA pseudouridine746 synthase
MGISQHPSCVTLPACEKPYPSILSFLSTHFDQIPRTEWQQRISDGKVLDDASQPISAETEYTPQRRIFYFREVFDEIVIPFAEEILFQDEELLVACKPHFLPVTPGGRYVDECLLNRLRKSTGIRDLAPLHRIDRETAGIVLFSVNKKSCARYGELFKAGLVEKTYLALSACVPEPGKTSWTVENRLEKGSPWFRMKTASGAVNARSEITLLNATENRARFLLRPITGKTHQLRIHMCGLGFGILNDNLYPLLHPESGDRYDQPLQLLARMVRFKDPITGADREFVSQRKLLW